MPDANQTQGPPPAAGLSEIFAKMNLGELPAMSHNVHSLIALTSNSRAAGAELSRVILKDYSLTNKVLQIVNSAYYALGRPCNSISKAVTILGFDAIRDMAMAIALFEDFVKSGIDKEGISKLMTRAFLSGLQARDLVIKKGLNVSPEEGFICALLHNLGRIIVCIYLPDWHREIEEKIAGGLTPNAACRMVFNDLTFREIGTEVAKFWNLSERVVLAMDDTCDAPRHKYDTEGYLQNLANFSNLLVDAVCEGENLADIFQKYGAMLSVEPEEALASLNKGIEVSEAYSEPIRNGLLKLKIRAHIRTAENNAKRGVWSAAVPEDQQTKKTAAGLAASPPSEALEALPISADKSVNDFIRDITESLMGNFELNDFYVNLLEALYRGIGFDRVILAIVNVQPTKVVLVGRFGLGEIDPEGTNRFEHPLAGPYAIPNAMKQGKDMIIPANQPSAFPDSLHYLVKDRNVYLFPILIDTKAIGLIYLDRKAARPLLDQTMIKNVRLFRDFAVMAIRKIHKG